MITINKRKEFFAKVWSLKMLGILSPVLMFIPFSMIHADIPGYVTAYQDPISINEEKVEINPKPNIILISPNSSNEELAIKTITITGSGFIPSSIAKINGSNRPTTFIDRAHLIAQTSATDMSNPNGFFVTVWNRGPGGGYSDANFFTIKSTDLNKSGDGSLGINKSTNTNTKTNNTKKTSSNFLSSAIFGANGFIPSGITQWILIAIIVLVIVILIRKIHGGGERYYKAPMKHK